MITVVSQYLLLQGTKGTQFNAWTKPQSGTVIKRDDIRDWTHNGDAVESDTRGPANLRLEGCGRSSTHAVSTSPGMRRVGASSAARPAPSQTPRPIRPFLRGSAPLGRAEAHGRRATAPAPRLWEKQSSKGPSVVQTQLRRGRLALAACRSAE